MGSRHPELVAQTFRSAWTGRAPAGLKACATGPRGAVRDTIVFVRRSGLAILVFLLTFSASGVVGLIVPEPCGAFELVETEDGACPPTCVTCGCCAQAVEPVSIVVTSAPDPTIAHLPLFPPNLVHADPGDILHVPKARVL
jgi:hypothetical protein